MNNPTTELIFPPRLLSSLRDLRDSDWATLIDRVEAQEPNHLDRMALELLVVRWSGCINCQSDSFRAMQGCTLCATQAVRRFRGSPVDLQRLFSEAVRELGAYLNEKA